MDGPYDVTEVPFDGWASAKSLLKGEGDGKEWDIDDKTDEGRGSNVTVGHGERPYMPGLVGAKVLFHFLTILFPTASLVGAAQDCDVAFNTILLKRGEERFNFLVSVWPARAGYMTCH